MTELWTAVDELLAQAPSIAALRHHRLDLLEARRRRMKGWEVDAPLREAERLAGVRGVSVRHLLSLMRTAVDQPLILMKGPEVSASYPFPQCRPFVDLDVLTPDVDSALAALLRSGFAEAGLRGAAHHGRPLVWPGVPLKLELHRTPKPVTGLPVPSYAELLRLTRPSRTGVEGVAGFVPPAHAVLLAMHAWAHGPLERLGQLIDIAAVLTECDRGSANEIARRWGCERLWRTTCATIDGLLRRRAPSMPVRLWARHLPRTREPRLVERSLGRLAGPAWALPPRAVPAGIRAELVRLAQRHEWETPEDQRSRVRQALRQPFKPISDFRPSSTTETTV